MKTKYHTKDRHVKLKIILALMHILSNNDWMTREEMILKLKQKGYTRGDKTIKRLLKTLREINFNFLEKKDVPPHRYKAPTNAFKKLYSKVQ